MPNIKDKSTVNAIAREFTSNGRNKTSALKAVGYKSSYYLGGRSDKAVWGNERVREAIAKIDAETAKKASRTVQQLDDMYAEDRTLARDLKQPSAAVSAVTGIARLYGMDKNADTANPDQATDLTAEDRVMLKAMVKEKQDKDMAKPKLLKDLG